MPYIGNTAADRFVASKAASVFSGDGSTTAFTLSYGVGSDEDILVSVDGVIQEPSVAYSVSGTTLTFTAAPSSNAGNNIFVYYLFRTVGTVSHPSSNALEATSGTFSSDVTVSGAFTSQGIDDNATSTAMTIDASQGVTLSSNGDATQLKIKRASASQDNGLSLLDQVDTAQAYFNLEGTATNNLQIASTAEIQFFSSSTLGNPPTNERARITSAGYSLFGTTALPSSSVVGFSISPSIVSTNPHFSSCGSATGSVTHFNFINGNGTVGNITTNGGGTAFNTSSDHRLKENVTADWDATTRLKQLNPVRFNFIADADTTVDGFLAHEVQSVVPEAISGTHNEVEVWKDGEELPDGVSVGDNKLDEDGNTIPVYQGIDQSKLVPLLVKTIQELEARITALENA